MSGLSWGGEQPLLLATIKSAKAEGAHLPTPHPDELLANIEALETWRKSVDKRKDVVRARRA